MNDWKKVLIAVDDTPTSDRGLKYAGRIIGNLPGVSVCLLHVYPEPPPDYYNSGKSLADYTNKQEAEADTLVQRCRKMLTEAGIDPEAITGDIRMAEQKTISATILEVQQQGEYGTIVVGRRGVSKAEEFLFGSISNALVHHSHDCTVWVVG
ncbi:MAG TPA: universal stress protein [Desulfobulbus sp.]|nr:universal stress protein [Desulfobulbus sp.]